MVERLDRVVGERLQELVPVFCTATRMLDMQSGEATASGGSQSSEL